MTETTSPRSAEAPTSPEELMELFAVRAGGGDVEGLIELYEHDAIFAPEFGVAVEGHSQLRMALPDFVNLEPQITYTSPSDVVIVGDTALVTNFWTMVGTAPDGSTVRESGTSADVCRRRPDGTWGVLIDQPRGVPAS